MKLSAEALTMIAECISASERITLETLPATDTDIPCDGCGTDSGALLPMRGLTPTGVQEMGLLAVCYICDADDRRMTY